MDGRQAREILSLYRPGSTVSPDPAMAEALDLVRRDPDLAAWFGLHCAAQTPAPAHLRDLPVPEALKHPVAAEPAAKRRRMGSRHSALLLAATVTVFIIFICFSFSSQNEYTFNLFRDRIVRMAQRSYPIKMVTSNPAQIREYFRTNGVSLDYVLSTNLEKLPGKGGAVFPWHNHPVSLLWLHSDENKDLYLFMANRQDIPTAPVPGKPQYNKIGRLMTVSWSDAERVYVLTGPYDAASLQKYLK